jgi:uncharacterized damage-inducible protein DinB
MKSVLCDLYAHQAWASSEHWRAIRSHGPAATDPAIHNRLHHIMLVEQGFLWVAQGGRGPFSMTKPEDFASLDTLAPVARGVDSEVVALVESMDDASYEVQVAIPWFKQPPLTLSLGQALLQAAMHSQYHRGQNATRLRELGGEPPLTDLIFWYWKGRPAPSWD